MTWLTLVASAALAHGTHSGDDVALNTGAAYESCWIDLHPELTQENFARFDREFAATGEFAPLAAADPLGRGHVAVGATLRKTFLDDSKPAWNDTFSHPADDHWLGQPGLPILQARVGLGARTDVEAMLTGDPQSNWGLIGLAARQGLWLEGAGAPLTVAGRLSAIHLLGAPELDVDAATAEVLASRNIGPVRPYAGVGGTVALAFERSGDVDLAPPVRLDPVGRLGLELAAGKFRASAEGTLAIVPSLAVSVGGSF